MKNKEALITGAPFPIVGIGASAGGLIALEQFFKRVPPTAGLGFVIVQHLDPHRAGLLVELLQRHTPMPVLEVTDRSPVERNHVYVIPPGYDLCLLRGVLHLMDPPHPAGLRLSIDYFFKSLADDRQQNSIGVVLSGMGSDGTQGLRAIRQAAGACFVQTPAAAQFDSMPRSAIDAGVADVVAPADELPERIPGCSTGEEAYSLGIVFKEVLETIHPLPQISLQIFASDLDKNLISTARTGIFARSIADDVSEMRLNRFFVEEGGSYRIRNEIREMVVFAEQNIIIDPPFTKIDILSCRNLMIYLESALQVKLIQLFHYSLNSGGVLVLGSAESIGSATRLFSHLPGKSRIYRHLDAPEHVLPVGFPAAFVRSYSRWDLSSPAQVDAPSETKLQELVEKIVLQRYSPAAVLVTNQGDALYFIGKTGKYLEPASGKPRLNLFAMAREGLNQALHEAFHRAFQEKTAVTLKNVRVAENGVTQYVNILVQPLEEPPALRGMALVVFNDVPTPRRRKSRGTGQLVADNGTPIETLLQELQQSREEAQSTREEMETSQEELKSTNEELTTSKEEMQSMNEELQTVNQELKSKVVELSRASNDMKNLLESTEIATLFLDESLKVRRFTVQTTRVIKLIFSDIGRPITDITTDLSYSDMKDDAREVLRTLVFHERDVPTSDGRWFKVRIMPYRTHENRIDGLVITFSDMTVSKKLETELLATQAKLAALMKNSKHKKVNDGLS